MSDKYTNVVIIYGVKRFLSLHLSLLTHVFGIQHVFFKVQTVMYYFEFNCQLQDRLCFEQHSKLSPVLVQKYSLLGANKNVTVRGASLDMQEVLVERCYGKCFVCLHFMYFLQLIWVGPFFFNSSARRFFLTHQVGDFVLFVTHQVAEVFSSSSKHVHASPLDIKWCAPQVLHQQRMSSSILENVCH